MVSAYGGMILGKKDYWHPDMLVNKDLKKDKIGAYYIDMRPKYIYAGEFDKNNIPLLDFNGKQCYFPGTIAQYALGNFDIFMDTQENKYFNICENCAKWFLNNLIENENENFGYINDYDYGIYKLQKPWFSSISQGLSLSLLSRCYSINSKKEYLEVCDKLLKSYEISSDEKGITALLNGEYFYEEYPSQTPSYVLNGFIFSLWGLYDYYLVSGSSKAYDLYDKGLKSLNRNLNLYNIKFINWSRYDLYPFKIKDITSIFYHKLHVEQLKAMYLLTDEDIYKKYYTLWEKSKSNKFTYIIATMYKIIHKISVKNGSNYVPSIKNDDKA